MTKLKKWFGSLFWIIEGDKKRLNTKVIVSSLISLFVMGIGAILIFDEEIDTSTVKVESTTSNEEIVEDRMDSKPTTAPKVRGLLNNSKKEDSVKNLPKRAKRARVQLKYAAKQVIERGDQSQSNSGLPTGTNMVGKLLTGIDTREENQFYKVLLLYRVKGSEDGGLPKNTILHGKIRYPGTGDKVYIDFDQAVLPDGQEIKISAQALSSKDYSPGIAGVFHGKGGVRMATALGMTMLSSVADVMTEREEAGIMGSVTMKSNLKNGLYHGVSKVSQLEASRQAAKLNAEPEYVTVESGKDLIISLTRRYNFE